jgi:two-component system sensor histidine kinase SenX3
MTGSLSDPKTGLRCRLGRSIRCVSIAGLAVAFVAGALLVAALWASSARRNAARRTPIPDRHRSPELAPQVLQALDIGVVVVDRDERVLFANPAARSMMLLDEDRIAVPALIGLIRDVTDSGTPGSISLDLATHRRGPDKVTYMAQATPLRDDGRVASIVLRFSDVTETRRLELVRRDFVANVSHELKTPVGALTLLAEAVQDAADDPQAVARFADRMQRESVRLGRLVQELIELSRLQGAEPLPGDKLVSVEGLVHEAMDRTRLLAEQSGIVVVDRAEAGLLVRGNETQLATAVANLVDNAIAYSPQRTRVGVSARVSHDETGTSIVEISVSDQGIGIAEADLDRVFERFYRVDPARSRATGGTGLGLAIVKHIATNHGGTVTVWSVVGSGSTFTVRLPLAGQQPESPLDIDAGISGHRLRAGVQAIAQTHNKKAANDRADDERLVL